MASAAYPAGLDGILTGEVDLVDDDIRVLLIDTADYTYSSAHDFLDDVASGSIVATAALASKTVSAGVYDAADTTFTSVSGDPSEALIIYRHDGGSDGARRLLFYIDGISVTPNGTNINVTWDSGTNKIVKFG